MSNQIAVYSENERYLSVDGTPVFLVGATHEGGWTPISDTDHDFLRDLNRLARVISRIDSPHVRGLVRIVPYFPRVGDLQPWRYLTAEGRYNLGEFDGEWARRLRAYLDAAESKGLVVSVELWDDWSITRGVGGAYDPGPDVAWNAHPFNPRNNVNYGEGALSAETDECGAPFYSTAPPDGDGGVVLDYQRRYVDRLLSITREYPNVIYDLSNESRASLQWSNYWAAYLREALDDDRLVGDMPSTNGENGRGECDPDLAPPTLIEDDRYGYVDVSQAVSRHGVGGDSGQEAACAGRRLGKYCRRMEEADRVKPLIVSKDYTNADPDGAPVIWSKFVGGAASARFHRPLDEKFLDGWDRDEPDAIAAFDFEVIEHLGAFAASTAFWRMRPDASVVSEAPADTTSLALSRPGAEYVIQLVGEGGGQLELALAPRTYATRWYDPRTGDDVEGPDGGGPLVVCDPEAISKLPVPVRDGTLVLHLQATE